MLSRQSGAGKNPAEFYINVAGVTAQYGEI
jgi:hypothetical protein